MKMESLSLILLTPANDELLAPMDDLNLVDGEACDGQCNAQPRGSRPVSRKSFNVKGWVAIEGSVGGSGKAPLDLAESKNERDM